MKIIDQATYDAWKDQPVLQDEDRLSGKYRTYGEMWAGEGYAIESTRRSGRVEYNADLIEFHFQAR